MGNWLHASWLAGEIDILAAEVGVSKSYFFAAFFQRFVFPPSNFSAMHSFEPEKGRACVDLGKLSQNH